MNVTPWQPSGAVGAIVTTLATDPAWAVAPAGTSRLRPDAFATVTFEAGQFVWSLEVTVPDVSEVSVTLYGLVLAAVKNTLPWVKPG